MDGIPTGIDFFDRGTDGFFRAKPYLVFGASGTGKSIFGLQFAQAGLAAGESALYICREKAEDLVQQGERLGFPLSQALDDERLILLEYDNDFREIVTRQGPAVVLDELRAQVDERAIRRVILDPVDPFFATLDDEALLRAQLRALTERFEELGWTPLLLGDDATVTTQPFVLRVFSEVCWGLFELGRDAEGESESHTLRVYKMRNVQLERSRFEFRIADGGIVSGEAQPVTPLRRPSFSRFRRVPKPDAQAAQAGVPAPGPAGTEESAAEGDVAPQPARAAPGTAAAAAPAAARDAQPQAARPAPPAEDELLDDAEMDRLERAAQSRLAADTPPSERPTVLVAEDDAHERHQIASWLEPCALVVESRDGLEALQLAQTVKPDVIVARVRMPHLNGIGLCRVLRERGVRVPVLFTTAGAARPGERLLCELAGGSGVIERPIELQTLLAGLRRLLAEGERLGGPEWPPFDATGAIHALGPHHLEPAPFRARLERARAAAQRAGVSLCLIGYEFRFFDREAGRPFLDRFLEVLASAIRTEDALCQLGDRRLAVLLLDADADGARRAVRRLHERMAQEAGSFAGTLKVKPKALYRLLSIQPVPLDGEEPDHDLLEALFRQSPRILEEDGDERPGEPVEKYPLLEAVFAALFDGGDAMTSPLDGARHTIETLRSGVRAVEIGEYLYRTQDPREDSPAGYRAARGSRIAFVARAREPERPVARIEDGRTFRGREI